MLQRHLSTSEQIAQLERLSEVRRTGTIGEAETADAEIDRFLRVHGITLGEYDSMLMARIDDEWGLSFADRKRARENAQVNAAPVDPSCPACAAIVTAGQNDVVPLYLPHVTRSRARPTSRPVLNRPRSSRRPIDHGARIPSHQSPGATHGA